MKCSVKKFTDLKYVPYNSAQVCSRRFSAQVCSRRFSALVCSRRFSAQVCSRRYSALRL